MVACAEFTVEDFSSVFIQEFHCISCNPSHKEYDLSCHSAFLYFCSRLPLKSCRILNVVSKSMANKAGTSLSLLALIVLDFDIQGMDDH